MKLYIASRLRHQLGWQLLARQIEPQGVTITSSWIWSKDLDKEQDLSPATFGGIWFGNEFEIKGSDALLVYASDDETLRGALVEVGMALAYGKRVAIVGVRSGTWIHHPQCVQYRDVTDAIEDLVSQVETL